MNMCVGYTFPGTLSASRPEGHDPTRFDAITAPEGKPRVSLRIHLAGRTVTAERKAQTAIHDAGADNIALARQGRLIAATSSPRPASAHRRSRKLYDLTPPETTMGRFQQGVANERYALVATPAGAAYLNENSHKGRLA